MSPAAAPTRRLSFLVFTCICTVSICFADDVFLSIDCGSSASYTDANLINWSGDGSYIDNNGEAKTVQSSSSISHVLDTLRVFTARRKNCYYIDSIRLGRVLVRASFYYGNYDGKSSAPTFDLMLDGNHWATVNTSSSDGDYVYYEMIYVMQRGSISVCVAQTMEGQFPFMSALELRALESTMYSYINDTYPLHLMVRAAYGANTSIRWKNDPYDRIWTPFGAGSSLTTLSGNVTFDGIAGLADNPPPAVLKNAVTALNPNTSINFHLPLPALQIPIYITFYFSELARLGPNDKRSFRVFIGNLSSQPITPPYRNFTEMYVSNYLMSSNTTCSLVPTNDTTLPPLINALELFKVGSELTNGTDRGDVSGLALLQNAFDVLQGWRGDPCLPAPYSWDWIECSNDSTPRVTSLLLGSYGLSGMLPNISSMDALETIDVHNNSINGPIPDSLAKLPNLKELNLSNNSFNGSIPTSLSQKNGLNIVVTGNPNLCNSGESCPTSDSNTSSKNSSGANMKYRIRATGFGITIPSLFIIFIGMFMGV